MFENLLGRPWGLRSSSGTTPPAQSGLLILTLVPWERSWNCTSMDRRGRTVCALSHAHLHAWSPMPMCPCRLHLPCTPAWPTPFLLHLHCCDKKDTTKHNPKQTKKPKQTQPTKQKNTHNKPLNLPCIKQARLILIIICE